MAKAFGTGIDYQPAVFAAMAKRYAEMKVEFNAARQRMARIPYGAALIGNSLSGAPGFQIGNVFVMAGIPAVMQAMLEDVRGRLAVGKTLGSVTVSAHVGEGTIAAGLTALQKQYPDIPLGSYPFNKEGKFGTSLVARGSDVEKLNEVREALVALVRAAGVEPLEA
jgi:molybdopterin-biosynthesis enzyme MoeA-like protein